MELKKVIVLSYWFPPCELTASQRAYSWALNFKKFGYDISTTEPFVIYKYLLQNPTKRIKTINSIKAKGHNACEFVWNEVTINPVTKVEISLKKSNKPLKLLNFSLITQSCQKS
jgi:hypothetical protein